MAKRFETVAEYKAYDVVKFADGICPTVYDGEVLTDSKHFANWVLGSVTAYAIECGRDPIQAYNKAIANGDDTHWAFSAGAILTDTPIKQPRRILVNYGDKIIFHGQEFTIEKAHNGNIELAKAKGE